MEKLDAFFPSAEVTEGVKRQLVNAGIDPNTIPMDWVVAAIAATHKWQQQTQEGLVHTVNLLGFKFKRGLDDHNYDYENPYSGEIVRVPAHRVYFFAGASMLGRPVSPDSIIISKRETDQCESCGVSAHCLKTIRDPRTDRQERLCNNCISLHDSLTVNQQGEQRICRDCTKTTCFHHPANNRQKRLGSG